MENTHLFLFVVLITLMITIFAAYSDLKNFTIPNWVSIAILLLYPLAVLLSPHDMNWLFSLLAATLVFVVGFILFALGLFGGGDVKLITVLSLWAGPNLLFPFIFLMVISGGVLVLFMALRHTLVAVRAGSSFGAGLRFSFRSKLPVPYGVAICVGSLVVFNYYVSITNIFW